MRSSTRSSRQLHSSARSPPFLLRPSRQLNSSSRSPPIFQVRLLMLVTSLATSQAPKDFPSSSDARSENLFNFPVAMCLCSVLSSRVSAQKLLATRIKTDCTKIGNRFNRRPRINLQTTRLAVPIGMTPRVVLPFLSISFSFLPVSFSFYPFPFCQNLSALCPRIPHLKQVPLKPH